MAALHSANFLPWIMLAFATINVIFLGGKRRAFGGYVAQLRKEFTNITLMELNWICDSYSAIGYLTSGLSISIIFYFNRRYNLFQAIGAVFVLCSCVSSAFVPNPHWMFLTHTFLHGIGSSLIIACAGLVVNEHFGIHHQYHLLATTLVSGGSIASIIFVPFFAFLIQKYKWRLSFLILGGIYFFVMITAAAFFKKNDEYKETSRKHQLKCSCEGISPYQYPLLVLWFIDRVITAIVTYGLILNLTDYLHRTQPDLLRSTVLTTLFAAGEGSTYLIGSLITAITKDLLKHKFGYILLVSSLACGTSLVTLEFCRQNAISIQILCFLTGFSIGPSVTFLFPAGEELTGLPGHLAYPFTLGGMGAGMLLSPLLTAKIAELFLYKWFFFVQGCLVYLKSLCLALIILLFLYYTRYRDDLRLMEESSSNEEIEVKFEEQISNEETEPLIEKEKQ